MPHPLSKRSASKPSSISACPKTIRKTMRGMNSSRGWKLFMTSGITDVRLKNLFKDLPVIWKGKDVEVTSLTSNSQEVSPGALFVVKKSHKYVKEAVEAGAVAVLTDVYDPFVHVTQLISPDVEKIETEIAQRFYPTGNSAAFLGVTEPARAPRPISSNTSSNKNFPADSSVLSNGSPEKESFPPIFNPRSFNRPTSLARDASRRLQSRRDGSVFPRYR